MGRRRAPGDKWGPYRNVAGTEDDPPRFWACVCGAGFCFGIFLLFLLADEDTIGQRAVTVVTAALCALFAGAASFVRGGHVAGGS